MTPPRLRRARPDDLPALIEIKEALGFRPDRAGARGGFLLGCPPERYAFLISFANVILLEADGRPAGFAIALPDTVLRASDLWQRRGSIAWRPGAAEPAEGETIAYFDQLALAPWASPLHAAPLALETMRGLAAAGHHHLYATTLAEPVANSASLPLLRAFGARIVGEVRETYPGVGAVLSRLHHAPIAAGLAMVAARAGGARVAASAARLAA